MMPERRFLLYDQIIGDAMKKEPIPLIIDTPIRQCDQEELAYINRQTCPPMQALGFYGNYSVLYVGEIEGVHRYQIRHDETIIANVAGSSLQQIIAGIVQGLRNDENVARIKARVLEPEEPPIS